MPCPWGPPCAHRFSAVSGSSVRRGRSVRGVPLSALLLPALAVTLFNGGLTWLRRAGDRVIGHSLMFSAPTMWVRAERHSPCFRLYSEPWAVRSFAAVFWLRGFGIAVAATRRTTCSSA